jgi:hypothetical protein
MDLKHITSQSIRRLLTLSGKKEQLLKSIAEIEDEISKALTEPLSVVEAAAKGALFKSVKKPKTSAKTNAEFIIFAVKQAKAAEAFGFTRNECCRNLKTALHQYWQNKTLGLHGQAKKKQMKRSRAAENRPLSDCTVEHVIPQMTIVNFLMDMESLTTDSVTDILNRYFSVMLVTHEEHARLNASGFRFTMPPAWDGLDIFSRYAVVGIEVASTSI